MSTNGLYVGKQFDSIDDIKDISEELFNSNVVIVEKTLTDGKKVYELTLRSSVEVAQYDTIVRSINSRLGL